MKHATELPAGGDYRLVFVLRNLAEVLTARCRAGRPARLVFVLRNLAEVLTSQRGMLERRGESGGDATEESRLEGVFVAHLTKVDRAGGPGRRLTP